MKTLINKATNIVLSAVADPENYQIELTQMFIDVINTTPCPVDENGMPKRNMFERYHPEDNTIKWWEYTGDPEKWNEYVNGL